MDLLNQTLNRFSTQIAESEGVSFNPDIFEANVVNLVILVGGLFYLLSGSLSESLSERQQKILGAIQESEEKNCPTERKEEIVIIIKSKM